MELNGFISKSNVRLLCFLPHSNDGTGRAGGRRGGRSQRASCQCQLIAQLIDKAAIHHRWNSSHQLIRHTTLVSHCRPAAGETLIFEPNLTYNRDPTSSEFETNQEVVQQESALHILLTIICCPHKIVATQILFYFVHLSYTQSTPGC